MNVVGVNGINTNGEKNVDLVLNALAERGIGTVDVRLPKRHTFSAWWGAKKDARAIAAHSEDGDVLVAHSFGCLRAAHAMQIKNYSAVFMIAPAMRKGWQFDSPGRVWCFYSPLDWVVLLGSMIPFHPFGRAGFLGFDQLEPHGHNIIVKSDHDDYFGGELFETVIEKIVRVAAP